MESTNKKEFKCPTCEDKGYIVKTEWAGTDEDYEVEKRCPDCKEE